MKTAIVYESTHHGNTKRLVDAVAEAYEVTPIDAAKEGPVDVSGYDRIGFASGIAFGGFYPHIRSLMSESLPEGKEVFFLYTCGTKQKGYTKSVSAIAQAKRCRILGEYGCRGYDTFGPFRLVGGIAKGHPDRDEIEGAVRFCEGICRAEQEPVRAPSRT